MVDSPRYKGKGSGGAVASACMGKVKHKTAASAARQARHTGAGAHPYRCNYCGEWHVGNVVKPAKLRKDRD